MQVLSQLSGDETKNSVLWKFRQSNEDILALYV